MKRRLDQALAARGLAPTRSQAESFIKLGVVVVNGSPAKYPGRLVDDADNIGLTAGEQYVSRAGLKLAGAAAKFRLDFRSKIVLDVGSSTGGFTDYALKHGAQKVIAVDIGTNQLHPSLRYDPRVELHEKTDIRRLELRVKGKEQRETNVVIIARSPDIVIVDVSFISLHEILPHISRLMARNSRLVAMAKPQFEAASNDLIQGVVKNNHLRRDILKSFEARIRQQFVIVYKADSDVRGAKGNRERFYLLKKLA